MNDGQSSEASVSNLSYAGLRWEKDDDRNVDEDSENYGNDGRDVW